MPRGTYKKPVIVDIFATGAPTSDPAPPPAASATDPAPTPAAEAVATLPAELTPDQRRIRELEDLLAKERGKKDPAPTLQRAKPGGKDNIVIHVVHNGFTSNGQTWYFGQEMEFTPNSKAYLGTVDRTGNSWLDLRDDESAQIDKYGDVMFRSGPWPGKKYIDADKAEFERLRGDGDRPVRRPTAEELAAADAAEAKRARAVPLVAQR